jgi:hypothetical protein
VVTTEKMLSSEAFYLRSTNVAADVLDSFTDILPNLVHISRSFSW